MLSSQGLYSRQHKHRQWDQMLLSKLAGDTKMSRAADLLDGWWVIQGNLERLEE